MAGECCHFPSRCGCYRAGARISLTLFLLCISLLTFAQLPTKKPEEFKPEIPDFNSPSAGWWTTWPEATREQREQWLGELNKAWDKWSGTLPDSDRVQERAAAVERSLKGIGITWKKYAEFEKVAVLPEVEFPRNPGVMAWATADAAVARGRQRLLGLQLELRQLDEALAQSLGQLRQQVVILREASGDPAASEGAALALLAAQFNHLNIIEQRRIIERQLGAWQEQIEHGESQLQRMLEELQYSAEATEQLQKTLEKYTDRIEKLAGDRTRLQSTTLESTDPAENMKKDLRVMELEVQALEAHLQKRKTEILVSINNVLNPEVKDQSLVSSGDLVETARTLVDSISRELNVRRRQVVAWMGEGSEAMSGWWRSFERVDSALGRSDDLIEDVLRYETAQLMVYREHQGWWATVRERAGHWGGVVYNRWRELADYKLFAIGESPVTLRDIARIFFVLVVAWLISSLTRRFLNRLVVKKHASESSMYNLGRVLHYTIIAIALVIALSMLGLDTSKLALIAGALSVGIGFGLQAIFSNFLSGLILLLEQPLRVGDLVELESGVFGRIRDINVRSTRITTRDNVDIMVPNSEFVTGRVINHTLDDPVRRIHVPFGVAYGSDPDLVRESAMEAAERVNITHTDWQRKTEVWLMEFGDSALNFKLVVWVNSNMVSPLGDPYALYNLELLREFNERGIEVPFPQRDLHLRSWEAPMPIERRAGK
ncbi:mechanosensitive ion channel family protein [Microbulbifer rhizosphaerae]|uniref:Small-conductance mechanosensitive channel/exonuclease VII small subunit n=1 Tax=Microbulbifer rhizosphaerae TaxID=1562603 RepID=A0A7W4WFE7_9GAMM|nr:mechanosensitive ion channel domain-containing protein [Microbulbifer rhizosphaerae]MBB3062616.1 small-conductance mechanosensitive channel/exonuclease VII small subunit [Microbulbifer rhizosphaerae]